MAGTMNDKKIKPHKRTNILTALFD
jgi:hypothetical protein